MQIIGFKGQSRKESKGEKENDYQEFVLIQDIGFMLKIVIPRMTVIDLHGACTKDSSIFNELCRYLLQNLFFYTSRWNNIRQFFRIKNY